MDHIDDLEQRVLDLELVRFSEIQDEHDDRISVLETVVEAFES